MLGNQEGKRLDKMSRVSKDHSERDLMEVERRKRKEGEKKVVVVYQPKDSHVIDTGAFIKTKMEYGLDFVFRLVDSVNMLLSPKINGQN